MSELPPVFQNFVGQEHGAKTMRFIYLLAFISISISPLIARSKDISVKTIQTLKRSVVPIICGFTATDNALTVVSTVGSGFFVNREGDFLTAAHVLLAWKSVSTPARPCFPAVYVPVGGWKANAQAGQFRWFKFTQCFADQRIDIAACRTIQNPFSESAVKGQIAPVRFSISEQMDGTQVAFTGFPLSYVRPITSEGFVASYIGVTTGAESRELVIDKATWPGASGSPVYLANGRVIGIIRQRGIGDAYGLAYARTSGLMVSFLKEKHIDFTE